MLFYRAFVIFGDLFAQRDDNMKINISMNCVNYDKLIDCSKCILEPIQHKLKETHERIFEKRRNS